MRRWRVAILLLVVLPVYVWLLAAMGLVACGAILDVEELFQSTLWEVIFTPSEWFGFYISDSGLYWVLLPAFLVAGTQVAFLLPVLKFDRARRGPTKSLSRTIWAAALVAGGLSVGLALAVLEFFDVFEAVVSWPENAGRLPTWGDPSVVTFWVCIALSWLIWSIVLTVFVRRRPGRLTHERVVLFLLGGTILEVLVVVPLDIMARRKAGCYSFAGTYFALCCSVWALLWLTGPGIVLAVTSRRRRAWAERHCLCCGYERGPSPGPVCPECGRSWG